VKRLNGVSIFVSFGSVVPISVPTMAPSAFLVNSSSMSYSIVAIRGRPTHRPASALATSVST
jgi:hypothetical protein